jgi:hypothetical protein
MVRNIISLAPAVAREGYVRRLERERRLVAECRFIPALPSMATSERRADHVMTSKGGGHAS